jgi:hypothetical protein
LLFRELLGLPALLGVPGLKVYKVKLAHLDRQESKALLAQAVLRVKKGIREILAKQDCLALLARRERSGLRALPEVRVQLEQLARADLLEQ